MIVIDAVDDHPEAILFGDYADQLACFVEYGRSGDSFFH